MQGHLVFSCFYRGSRGCFWLLLQRHNSNIFNYMFTPWIAFFILIIIMIKNYKFLAWFWHISFFLTKIYIYLNQLILSKLKLHLVTPCTKAPPNTWNGVIHKHETLCYSLRTRSLIISKGLKFRYNQILIWWMLKILMSVNYVGILGEM